MGQAIHLSTPRTTLRCVLAALLPYYHRMCVVTDGLGSVHIKNVDQELCDGFLFEHSSPFSVSTRASRSPTFSKRNWHSTPYLFMVNGSLRLGGLGTPVAIVSRQFVFQSRHDEVLTCLRDFLGENWLLLRNTWLVTAPKPLASRAPDCAHNRSKHVSSGLLKRIVSETPSTSQQKTTHSKDQSCFEAFLGVGVPRHELCVRPAKINQKNVLRSTHQPTFVKLCAGRKPCLAVGTLQTSSTTCRMPFAAKCKRLRLHAGSPSLDR